MKTIKSPLRMVLRVLIFTFFVRAGLAQTNVHFLLANDAQVSNNQLEFDVFIISVGAPSFELASHQFNISYNPSMTNGGSLTAAWIPGTSQLTTSTQLQSAINTIVPGQIRLAGRRSPGAGSGSVIASGAGTRVGRMRLTNTVPWASVNANLGFSATTINPRTSATAYKVNNNTPFCVAGITIPICDGTTTYSTSLTNPVLNAPTCTAPTLSAAVTNVTCAGGTDGVINLTTTGGSPTPFIFTWSNGSSSEDLTGLSAGTYTVTVTTSTGGCSSTSSYSVASGASNITYYADNDGDGYGNVNVSMVSCTGAPSGFVASMTDCDDNNSAANPGVASDGCNGVDNDCNGQTDEDATFLNYYLDSDNDGFGAGTASSSCSPIAGLVTNNNDCNDNNNAINPGTAETCNSLDDNCNGSTDEGLNFQNYYADVDGDSFGAGTAILACTQPANTSLNNLDCNDNNAAINPNAAEVCNGLDDDCDGTAEDGLIFQTYFVDADGDGFGAATAIGVSSCSAITGSVTDNADCNDGNAAINPNAAEVCNALDDDCDGTTDDGLVFQTYNVDADGDSYGSSSATGLSSCVAIAGSVTNNADCNDDNAAINPAAAELCDGVDNDCDGSTDEGLTFLTYYVDDDGDNFGAGAGTSSCAPIPGSVSLAGDCNDNNSAVNPGVASDGCNGVDNDCDGQTDEDATFLNYYLDSDNDGFGAGTATSSCSPITGFVTIEGDCNDNNNSINSNATEVCNGVDDDCNNQIDEGVLSTFFADADNDGFGNAASPVQFCTAPSGHVANSSDCDDNNSAINPNTPEVCNGVDDDCDGQIDEGCGLFTYFSDSDGDGYGNALSSTTTLSPTPPIGYVSNNTDCNDADSAIHPGAIEICNGLDDDCDGSVDNQTKPLVAGSISGNSLSCRPRMDGTATFNLAGITPGASPVWSVPNGFNITSGQGTSTLKVSFTATALDPGINGQLCVNVTDVCGSSTTICTTIDYQIAAPITPPSISGPSKPCPGDVATYSFATVPRASNYIWTLPQQGVSLISGQGSNILQVSIGASFTGGSISVIAANACGSSTSRIRSLVNSGGPPTPTAISGTKVGLCNNTGITYTTTAVSGATSYQWTVTGGGVIAGGQGTRTITVNFPTFTSGQVSVQAVNGCGNSQQRIMSITGAPGKPDAIIGLATACKNTTEAYSIPSVNSAASNGYNWMVTGAGNIISGQGSKNITVLWYMTATGQALMVSATNACGTGPNSSRGNITVSSCSRAELSSGGIQMEVYPNPALDRTHVVFNANSERVYNLRMTDMAGRTVLSETGTAFIGRNEFDLYLGNMKFGLYFIEIRTGDEYAQLRIAIAD